MAWSSIATSIPREMSSSFCQNPTSYSRPVLRVLKSQSLNSSTALSFPSNRRQFVSIKFRYNRRISACSRDNPSLGFSEENADTEEDSLPNNPSTASDTEGKSGIRLPRRSLLVQFTCNACGERTERLINRVAYDRGTVFLQCAGCGVYHKFVDNLNLVEEYDLRDESD
ncbi:zim17-type zinc finger protein [Wolffia australiana]